MKLSVSTTGHLRVSMEPVREVSIETSLRRQRERVAELRREAMAATLPAWTPPAVVRAEPLRALR